MESPSATASAAHILVIPFPAPGHMIPILDLTHRLITHGPLRVTVVLTPENLHSLQPLLSLHPSTDLSALVLPLGVGVSPPEDFHSLLASLRSLRNPLLQWITTHSSPPSTIISDILLSWTHQLATQLGIKRIVFSPIGAFAISLTFSARKTLPPSPLTENGSIDENGVVLMDSLPCHSQFSCWELLPLYKAFGCSEENSDSWRREICSNNIASWGFVFNTFDALDSVYLNHIKSLAGHDRIWAVGPPANEVREGSGPDDELLLSWLDKCNDAEVLYVCFGAQLILTDHQINVLALALEKSEIKFVWKVNEPVAKLPPGFESRVAGRGLVLREWAPQVMILKHRVVGSFLTHCGWNAVLEGLDAGVLLLAWPLVGDQIFNAKYVVEKLKVGVLVGQGMSWRIPNPNELAKVLVHSVSEGSYKEERSRAMQLSNKAKEAISEGGSSSKELNMFVQHLLHLPKPHPDVIRECQRWIEAQEMKDGVQ